MADSSTTNFSWTLCEVGASSDSWGTKLNANWTSADSTVKGVSNVANAAAVKASNLSDLASAATARTNLGLANHELITMTSGGNLTTSGNITATGTIDATKLSGNLPSISGASLTGIVPFPSGTRMTFFQAAAPTGWSQVTTATLSDAALRVVTGSGGGTGGSTTFSTAFTHTHAHTLAGAAHTLPTSQMPAHTHTVAGGSRNFSTQGSGGQGAGDEGGFTYYAATDSTGGGASHSHTLSGAVTSATIAPKYVDMIIASKD